MDEPSVRKREVYAFARAGMVRFCSLPNNLPQ